MRIFATEFTVINRSYYLIAIRLPVDLVVALREGYPECFCIYDFSVLILFLIYIYSQTTKSTII